MRRFAVAGIQMSVAAGGDNLALTLDRIKEVAQVYPWVQMVLMSELAVRGQVPSKAEPMPGPTEAALCAAAAQYGLWLIPGSLYEQVGDVVYNTTPVINPNGEVVGRYRKMFPFAPYEKGIASGTEPFVFDVPDVGRFGVSICYDMWFPETTRWLATLGAEVILHPTLTNTIDRDVELAIVRAAAAQNQCFVLDVNGVAHGGNGRSLFVGPDGHILHQAGTQPEIIPLELDLERVNRGRRRGLRGLGQVLKSFRDRPGPFDFYQQRSAYLDQLGPLEMPTRTKK